MPRILRTASRQDADRRLGVVASIVGYGLGLAVLNFFVDNSQFRSPCGMFDPSRRV